MPILYILCGVSGSGKTTWAREFIKEKREMQEIRYVSRDEIRFEMLDEEEDYFAHEKEVFARFVLYLAETLKEGVSVIADATHLNEFSRRKLTQAIDMRFTDYEIVYVTFDVDVNTCIARNENRTGRRHVPENIIRNMCRDFREPELDEDERTKEIIHLSTNRIIGE